MHFNVAVITTDEEDINEILEPFCESLEVEEHIYRTKDELLEDAKRWKKRLQEKMKDDKEFVPNENDKALLKADTDEEILSLIYSDGGVYDEEGNELVTYNPNTRWDWWEVGGRWSDFLRFKDGGRGDAAYIKNVDFSDNDAVYYEVLNWWNEYVEGEDNPDAESYKEKYTAESLAKIRCKFHTADVLMNGEWYSMDDMNNPNEWINEYYDRFIRKSNPNDVITIVDCHI